MFQPARGTRDFLPEEMRRRNWVLDNIRAVFEAYGYEPLGTPAFENWEMLKIKSGEEVMKQIYYFKDKSNRELGLRFEWTASLARIISTHRELSKPFKRYAIGPVWRYERPSEKRFREFWQADVDVVGVSDPIADVEVLAVAVDCLKRIGFKSFLIRLNDRRLMEAVIHITGLPYENSLEIFRAIDKLEKIGIDGVMNELAKVGASKKGLMKLLELISKKGDPNKVLDNVRSIIGSNQIGLTACDALAQIFEYSKSFGIESYLIVDLSLVRGLDYYTGPVFEIYAEDFENSGSIAGGGRYDELVELMGGEPTPMTGISLGIERIVPLIEKRGIFDKINLGIETIVAPTSEKIKPKAIEIVQKLRRAGISAEMDLMGRSLRRQLEIANKKGINKVVIVGEKELEDSCVTIRDMTTAKQMKVDIQKIIEEMHIK